MDESLRWLEVDRIKIYSSHFKSILDILKQLSRNDAFCSGPSGQTWGRAIWHCELFVCTCFLLFHLLVSKMDQAKQA